MKESKSITDCLALFSSIIRSASIIFWCEELTSFVWWWESWIYFLLYVQCDSDRLHTMTISCQLTKLVSAGIDLPRMSTILYINQINTSILMDLDSSAIVLCNVCQFWKFSPKTLQTFSRLCRSIDSCRLRSELIVCYLFDNFEKKVILLLGPMLIF